VERVDADDRLARVGAHALGEGWPHVHADRLDLPGAVAAELGEELIEGAGVLAGLAPHDLPAGVVGDQGEVVVVLLPRHLVHADVDQAVETVVVQPVSHDPLADPPDGVPVDTQEPGDRGLVRLGGQERGHVLEVAGEPGPVPGKRHHLGHHPAGRTVQPAQLRAHHHERGAQVQVPPRRGDRTPVVAPPGGAAAVRAPQPAPPQRQIHHQQTRLGQRHADHPHAGQVQQTVQ